MKSRTAALSAVLVCIFLSGCEQPPIEESGKLMELCTDPRPQICTNEYNPVCATLNDGTVKTYATGCTACSDPLVTGWNLGECD
jgi:hypothetical protein